MDEWEDLLRRHGGQKDQPRQQEDAGARAAGSLIQQVRELGMQTGASASVAADDADDETQESVPLPDGYVRLRDDGRGLEMIVPCGDINAEQYGLVTRNYIEADEQTKQAGYTDYRFVRIADAHRKGE